MVHALSEIQRTLRPGGVLIDLRPIRDPNRQLEVICATKSMVVGDFDVYADDDPDDEAAHEAVLPFIARYVPPPAESQIVPLKESGRR